MIWGWGVQDSELTDVIRHIMVPSASPLVILFCQNFNFNRDHPQVDLILDLPLSTAATCPLLHHLPCSWNRGKDNQLPRLRWLVGNILYCLKDLGKKMEREGLVSTGHPGARYFHKHYLINKETFFQFWEERKLGLRKIIKHI